MLELLQQIERTEKKLSRLLPKPVTLSTPKFTNEIHKTWKQLCEFSELRLEAFGSRSNQYRCEQKGEHADFSALRYLHNNNKRIGKFLEEIASAETKTETDWLRKARASLECIIDITIDQFKPIHGDKIFSPAYLSEVVDSIEHLVRNYHQTGKLMPEKEDNMTKNG